MTLQQLEYALAISNHKSFSKAAKFKNISQPALSAQVRKLEQELGIKIFDRSTSPLELSPDGVLFLEKAEKLVADSKDLVTFISQLKTPYADNIRMGVIPTLSPFLIPLFSRNLTEDHPDISLMISELLTHQVVNQVKSGQLDMGIISTPIDTFDIISDPIFYERFFLYTSENMGNPLDSALSEINNEELWVLEEGNCFRDQINDFCDLKRTRAHMQYRCSSIDSLIRVVDNHGGQTILPELTTITLDENQEYRIAPIGQKAREIGIIARPKSVKSKTIELVRTYILENLPEKMKSKEGLEIVDPDLNF